MLYVKKMRTALLLTVLLSVAVAALPAQDRGKETLEKGIDQFGNGNYQQALLTFRDVMLNSSWESYHGSAYYWIGRSYMALEKGGKALENLDFFLRNFPEHRLRPDALYQKARLLISRDEHEKAIELLYSFTDSYPEHSYRGNAFFWIGEALYSLGHFEEARRLFSTVVQDYPRSYKYEAARYRLSLIDLKKRERELLKLLRISHEEYLKALEQFRRKEKEYEHAISSYQRKLAAASTGDDNTYIAELNKELQEQRSTLQTLRRENEELRRELADLRSAAEEQKQAAAEEAAEPAPEKEPVEEEVPEIPDRQLFGELLRLKEEALSLKADYLKELRSREGDS